MQSWAKNIVPITLLRENPRHFQKSQLKTWDIWGKGGHILKIIVYTDELPLI
jgi:hypothetical protein